LSGSDSLGKTAGAVDRTHLERLIDLLVAQGRERLAAAEQGMAAGDAGAIVRAAHALKSSAGNLGASPLGTCAADIERRGLAGAAVETLAPLVATLNDAFGAACASLDQIRADVVRRTGDTR
jgi:HPt (histidine-containing phosphotransfer) domain-containing protein